MFWIILTAVIAVLYCVIVAKIIATYYIKIIDSYTKDILKMIEDLIADTVKKDRRQ